MQINQKYTVSAAQLILAGLAVGLMLGALLGISAYRYGWNSEQSSHSLAAKGDTLQAGPKPLSEAPQGELLYSFSGNERLPEPLWVPVRGYVENGNTIIEFDRPIDPRTAPGLYLFGSKKQVLYSVEGNLYKVDGLLTESSFLRGPSVRPSMKSEILVMPEYEPWRPDLPPPLTTPPANQ